MTLLPTELLLWLTLSSLFTLKVADEIPPEPPVMPAQVVVKPAEPTVLQTFSGKASWYSLRGNTAWWSPPARYRSYRYHDPYKNPTWSAAHKTLPLGSIVRVSRGSKSCRVIINDRGPYTPGRILDLSVRPSRYLNISGVSHVQVEVLRRGLDGPDYQLGP